MAVLGTPDQPGGPAEQDREGEAHRGRRGPGGAQRRGDQLTQGGQSVADPTDGLDEVGGPDRSSRLRR